MITADTSHTFAVRARDGVDSQVSHFLKKLETQIHERSRQGMFWLYVNYENDEFMRNASRAEVELAKMKLQHLGYAVVEYKPGTWGIAW